MFNSRNTLHYNCTSELHLSLRLGNHFNKSLINILQLVWLFYDNPECIYDSLKLTFIFSKMGVIQVLSYPCWSRKPNKYSPPLVSQPVFNIPKQEKWNVILYVSKCKTPAWWTCTCMCPHLMKKMGLLLTYSRNLAHFTHTHTRTHTHTLVLF